MEEKLIVAVCKKPIIYDQSSPLYRDRTRKDIAWREVSEEVGLSVDACRKRWKTLRDTYAKECKKERERQRSGAAADSVPKWKFLTVLSFLRPFITPRETSGNMATQARFQEEQEEQAGISDDPGDEPDVVDESEAERSILDFSLSETSVDPGSSTASSELAGPSTPAPAARLTQKRARTRVIIQPTPFEKNLMEFMKATTPSTPHHPAHPAPPLDDDQHFLLGLCPLLKKVPASARESVKFQIHKLLYDNMEVTLNLLNSPQTEDV